MDEQELQIQSAPPLKRPRVLMACQRCKAKKTKCNGRHPTCSSCERTGSDCIWPQILRYDALRDDHTDLSYVTELEGRVASLERLLRTYLPDVADDHLGPYGEISHESPSFDDARKKSLQKDDDTYSALANGVGFLSLRAAAEPYFVGSTSGFSLARMVHLMLSSSFSTLSRQDMDLASPNTFLLTSTWESIASAEAAPDPPSDIADELVAIFFSRIHLRYPVIDWMAFRRTYKRKHDLDPNGRSDRMRLFVLHMVYAMGARIMELGLRSKYGVSPESHYATALQFLDASLEIHGVENVQALLLLALFSLRASGSLGTLGGWHVLGLAMRVCTELGLHRKVRYGWEKDLSPYRVEITKRNFWTAYLLDRSLCITLGRPFAIAEHEIDAELPIDIDEGEDDSNIVRSMQQQQVAAEGRILMPSRPTNLSSFIHMCRLRRIESGIQREIYGADVKIGYLKGQRHETLDKYIAQLNFWLENVPYKESVTSREGSNRTVYDSYEYFQIYYSKAVRLLLQPRIAASSMLCGDDPYVVACAKACGDICKYYKIVHQAHPLSYNLLTLHSVFIAGTTLLYCVWLNRQLLKRSAPNDIRACSSVLFVIAERWPAAKEYRDVYEVLASHMQDIFFSDGHNSSDKPSLLNREMDYDFSENIRNIQEGVTRINDEGFWNMYNNLFSEEAGIALPSSRATSVICQTEYHDFHSSTDPSTASGLDTSWDL